MDLPDRTAREVVSFEMEFLDMLIPMMAPGDRPKKARKAKKKTAVLSPKKQAPAKKVPKVVKKKTPKKPAVKKGPKKVRAAKPAKKPAPLKKLGSLSSKSGGSLVSGFGAPASPVAPALTRKESQSADKLYRRGTQTHKWQYVNDRGAWADYDKKASDEVELAYASWLVNPHVDVRSVLSGDWEYMVDFNQMQQQNTKHNAHKIRKIRRVDQ